ncbi:cytochrome b/b6 domain-containing protein [Methylocystis sp. H4A]|uniref:cytochrome b/b6 domain-containing protein n=1 Tax=Methylocystis sp. H4A TaxID=2785788 RepID=UPI0018C2A9F8|nr:cytochrome b/b6 domain-containing protein [Methylocystis sp. H4A]MBG0801591.1 cytochrome b/b6 domain-containing protein [Methylocystis sp. H4A]MBG0801911.1 cytochrome b/b6 domain-containing protein [Methylocystis sp. H4A]
MVAASGADERRTIHPLFVRVTHWVNAFAIFVMVLSGWRIYNASPLFGFEFPKDFTLGGWLAGALAWHFAAMWLLALNGFAYLAYGLVSGHFRRSFMPISLRGAFDDLLVAMRGHFNHAPGRYNAAQRLLYVGVILAVIVAILSGLAIWKPVQLQALTALMGGYETARHVHFFAMAMIVAFLVVHIGLAVSVKGILAPMFTGRAEAPR